MRLKKGKAPNESSMGAFLTGWVARRTAGSAGFQNPNQLLYFGNREKFPFSPHSDSNNPVN